MDISVPASPAVSASNFLKRNTFLFALIAGFSSPALALQWSVTPVSAQAGLDYVDYATGNAINDLGQVAGDISSGPYYYEPGGYVIDHRYSYISSPGGGSITLIDEGPPEQGLRSFNATAINNSGQVVGSAAQGSSTNIGWQTGPDGTGLQTRNFVQAVDINNAGAVLYRGDLGSVEVVQPDGTITTVISSTDTGIAHGINDAGQVAVGLYNSPETGPTYYTGAIWSEASGFEPVFVDGASTMLHDINNNGQVLGTLTGDLSHMFVFGPDGVLFSWDLPGRLTNAHMNDVGQILGTIAAGPDTFAFLTSIGSSELINLYLEEDIINAGLEISSLNGINNHGQIVGTGMFNASQPVKAFILTPVPEPETWAMMLAGLSMLGLARRTSHRRIIPTRQKTMEVKP